MNDVYDFIVVGSGAGGSAVAARLAEGGARTLLVEQGGKTRPQMDASEAIYRYYSKAGLTASLGNCLLPIPTGTALGGTTAINSGTCLRTPPEILARWERAGSGGFQAAEFDPYLERAWKRVHVHTAPERTASPCSKLFLRGLELLGIPGGHLLERAESGCEGAGRCCFICPNDGKMTSAKAFLEPLSSRSELEVALQTRLAAVQPNKDHTAHAWLRASDGATRKVACQALILACGTLQTPYFVRRYRLGSRWRLAGDGLSVHPASKIFADFDEPVRGWQGVPQGAGLLNPEEPRIRYEGVHTPPELAALVLPFEGQKLARWMRRYDHLATFGFMIQDSSRGRVRYPLGPSLPFIRYDMQDGDFTLMRRGLRFLGRVFLAAGANRVVLPINREPNVFSSLRGLEAADLSGLQPRDLQMMAFHPLGTCGMGRVVDENLNLCDGVYICDGSVIPESLGVNPQITIYAFALRLADHLLGRGRHSSIQKPVNDRLPTFGSWKMA